MFMALNVTFFKGGLLSQKHFKQFYAHCQAINDKEISVKLQNDVFANNFQNNLMSLHLISVFTCGRYGVVIQSESGKLP